MEKREQGAKSNPPPARTRTAMLLAIMLVALTAAVYWQASGFGLLNYDDNEYVSENLHVTAGLSGEGVVWAFTGRHVAYWAPLTWISLMLDSQLGHGNPGAYHVTNVVLHGLSVLLLYLTLALATKGLWKSAFVAALSRFTRCARSRWRGSPSAKTCSAPCFGCSPCWSTCGAPGV